MVGGLATRKETRSDHLSTRSCLMIEPRLYEELRQSNVKQGGDEDNTGRTEVKVVDFGTDLCGQSSILNLLQSGAVDVPNATLPDVS